MNELEKRLLEEINQFVSNAIFATNLFYKQFSLDKPPIGSVKRSKLSKGIIPFKGILNIENAEIAYQFHGNGCRFIFPKKRIIDINYQLPEGTYDGRFSFYKIWEYIQSIIPEFEDKDLLEEKLEKLDKLGLIISIPFPIDFKEKLAISSGKTVEVLEKEGFFEIYKKPKYKSYKLKKNF